MSPYIIQLNYDYTTESYSLLTDTDWPNNSKLPLIIYRNTVILNDTVQQNSMLLAEYYESLFCSNSWYVHRRAGMFDTHHYHSAAHECLAVYTGTATIQFGSDRSVEDHNNGVESHELYTRVLTVTQGDIIIIPSGIGHHSISGTSNFMMCGGYPVSQSRDICYINEMNDIGCDVMIQRINNVPLPITCPIYNTSGTINQLWNIDTNKINNNHNNIDLNRTQLRIPNPSPRAVSMGNTPTFSNIQHSTQQQIIA